MKVEVIEDFARLLDIKQCWSGLLSRLPGITPFQTPEWLLSWWQHFGSGKLQVLAFRSGQQLAGVVPCFGHQWEGKRQLTLIGTGISDYLEPAIAPEHASGVIEALVDWLRNTPDWQICNWQDLNGDTPLQALASIPQPDSSIQPDTACSEIPLTGRFEQWWEQRPHGLRRNVRRYFEKALGIDRPEFCVTTSPEPEAVEALLNLHTARWRNRGEPGMIAANHSAQFLREVFARFSDADQLRLFSLHFQSRIVSAICAFAFRNTLYAYLSGFDPEYENLGFGRTLLFHSIRYAFENGCASWNFLRGDEAYKLGWGAQRIEKYRLIITRAV